MHGHAENVTCETSSEAMKAKQNHGVSRGVMYAGTEHVVARKLTIRETYNKMFCVL